MMRMIVILILIIIVIIMMIMIIIITIITIIIFLYLIFLLIVKIINFTFCSVILSCFLAIKFGGYRMCCFRSTGSCAVPDNRRIACGVLSGNNKREACERRGCCYNNSVPGTKFCFHPGKLNTQVLRAHNGAEILLLLLLFSVWESSMDLSVLLSPSPFEKRKEGIKIGLDRHVSRDWKKAYISENFKHRDWKLKLWSLWKISI